MLLLILIGMKVMFVIQSETFNKEKDKTPKTTY